MRREPDASGEREFRLGIRLLGEHRPDRALPSLRAAAEACPASRSGELERRLYWLAMALLRLDRPELALKSLASAQKLRPRGLARSAYESRANEYGMPRRASRELDDFYAFYSIKIGQYFARKGSSCFVDCGEKDAVVRLVADAWRALAAAGRLRGLDASAKLARFRGARIDFPSFGLGGESARQLLRVDFRRKAALCGEERCPCGSGLPFRQCCGRTAGLGELACE